MADTETPGPLPLEEAIKFPSNLAYAYALIDEYCDQQNMSRKITAMQEQWAKEAKGKALAHRKRKP